MEVATLFAKPATSFEESSGVGRGSARNFASIDAVTRTLQKRDRVRRLSVPVRGGAQPGVFGVFAAMDLVTLQMQGVSSFEESSVAVRGGVQLGGVVTSSM